MLVSLLSRSLSIGSGGGQTPQWAWALKRDSLSAPYCHLSCPPMWSTQHLFSFSFQSLHLNNLFLPSFSPSCFISISIFAAYLSLLAILSVYNVISFSFALVFPLSLSFPATHLLPHLPSASLAVLPCCLDYAEHGQPHNIHHSGTSRKQNRPPSWTATITVCNAKASSHSGPTDRGRGGKESEGGRQNEVGCGPVCLH